jgi:hypothetical protein
LNLIISEIRDIGNAVGSPVSLISETVPTSDSKWQSAARACARHESSLFYEITGTT